MVEFNDWKAAWLKLANYTHGFPVEAKLRYKSKLELISGVDPCAKDGHKPATLPPVDHGCIVPT